MIRVKLISSDGGWQYIKVLEVCPVIYLACRPLLKLSMVEPDYSTTTMMQKRTYSLYGRNENGVYVYREDI